MKKLRPVLVTWNDANGDASWIDERDIEHAPTLVTEIGLLLRQDDAGITTCKAITPSGHVYGQGFIPASNIVSIVPLKEKP